MSQIRISIINPSETEKVMLEVPNNVPVSVLCDAIVEAMGLSAKSDDGDKVFYYLENENNSLISNATLEENNVEAGTVFQLRMARGDSLIKNPATIGLTQNAFSYQEKNVHLISSNLLRVSIPIPELISVWDYFASIVQTMKAIEFIYYVFAILSSRNNKTIDQFIKGLENAEDLKQLSTLDIYTVTKIVNIQALQVVSSHYGSPASFDLLGVGKALEIVKEITTDVLWRGKHDIQMAELERKNKEIDVKKANLDVRKTNIEIESEQVRLQRLKLENEKMMIEIATQKLDFIQRTYGLALPDENKKIIISTLLPKMIMLTQTPQDLLNDNQSADPLLPNE